jgi:hypothetical protein
MGCDFADVDGDLAPDLIVTNLAMEANALYVNDGRGRFDDQAFARGVGRASVIDFGWGVRFFDFEHDGDADCLVFNGHLHAGVARHDASQEYSQRPKLLLNDGRGHFAVAGAEGGPFLAQKIVGRGLITADFDRDGDLDLAVSTYHANARLLRNEGARGRWLAVELVGDPARRTNRDAIGARLLATTAQGLRIWRLLTAGEGFLSAQSHALEVGLGAATHADLEIRWPNGEVERFPAVAADGRVRIVQGRGVAERE